MVCTDCSTKRKVNLYKSIAANNAIPYRFVCVKHTSSKIYCMRLVVSSAPEKPRWVLVGLQNNRSDNQGNNAALFDHCNLTNMQVWLNHFRYPSVDMTTDFGKEQYAGVYKSFYNYDSRYYEINNRI